MRDAVEQIRQKGAELVVVGCGRPEQAANFRDEEGLDFPLLTDPKRKAYAEAELERGLGATFSLKAAGSGFRAFKKGFRQQGVQGDPWQQGGVFVFSPEGETLYAYRSREAGDHPDPAEFLAVLS